MSHRLAWLIILFALGGALFSGYLTWQNYWGSGCGQALVTCGVGPTTALIFGQPTCVYGFVMFAAVLILALASWRRPDDRRWLSAILTLGIAGTLFAAGLSVYELVWLDAWTYGLPACVYGLIFYLGILVSSVVAWRSGLAAPKQPM
jgi:uncharacterized membrane protein